ncbi:MAG: Asp-tRNA(Asn)/Glu-tRNA(Gln) amidotransferase GatCAB subunit C [Acidobacteria bacterium]|nr:MAG: Asp-tRNA(Asn)/Glu-tRNA(Gln) amidotransferase GatCAB subunit C [Acidobacteriota bacterium]REK08593.1 MAG: Asp-tRNA(Asn)/Glu-tRNA(Gln) amidotransferase GatCAB subunit C [Acidobacteriota bacterium]
MTLRPEEIRRVAELARLELSPEEEARYGAQLARVVEYIDQLSGYEPSRHPREEALVEQPDEVQPSLPLERFLDNAPERLDRFLVVPQVKKVDGG